MDNLIRFINSSERLKRFTNQVAKPCVAVLGSFNSGKSTLVNRLLGDDISPVGILPTTSSLLYFNYGSSFKATFTAPSEKKVFHRLNDLHSYLSQLKSPSGRVDIEIPSYLLKKCQLIDTPGIDSLNSRSNHLIEEVAAGADKVIYLFHQRGIEDLNRIFLHKLAAIWKDRNLNDISFWLNCNLGKCDGTSLETTRVVLRDVFLSQMRLNTINTLEHSNIEALNLFLEVELARDTLRQVSGSLKKIDSEMPQKTKKIVRIRNDSLFLSEFWRMQEIAGQVLEAGRLLHSLPSVLTELEAHLNEMNSINVVTETRTPGGKPYRLKEAGIKENKKALLELISYLSNEKRIKCYLDSAKLKELFRQIEEERFTVVAAGGFSTGKSTFFNALLKEEILPTADGPTTACVTKITCGRWKTATVHAPLQVTLHIFDGTGEKAGLCREQLAALEKWLAVPGDIAYLEAYVNGRFKRVDMRELTAMVNRVKEVFAAGTFARTANRHAVPVAFKLVSPKTLAKKCVLQKVRVTFKNSGTRLFDLSNPSGLKAFQNAVGPENAFKIDVVDIQHPSGFLKLADFIDTPGLDWIQKHHYERTSNYIRQSDAYLIFFNARHILNNMDRENFPDLFWPYATEEFSRGKMSAKETGKFFFVINFADALTPAQREAVYNFVRKNLKYSKSLEGKAVVEPQIFLISALKGLTGCDGGMSIFLKNVEKSILRYRGRDFYLVRAGQLFSILDSASQKIKEELIAESLSYKRKIFLRKTQDLLRKSKRKLKDIRNAIYFAGGT